MRNCMDRGLSSEGNGTPMHVVRIVFPVLATSRGRVGESRYELGRQRIEESVPGALVARSSNLRDAFNPKRHRLEDTRPTSRRQPRDILTAKRDVVAEVFRRRGRPLPGGLGRCPGLASRPDGPDRPGPGVGSPEALRSRSCTPTDLALGLRRAHDHRRHRRGPAFRRRS